MLQRSRSTAFATLVATIGLLALSLPAFAGVPPTSQFWVDEDGQAGPGCDGDDLNAYQTIQEAVNDISLINTRIYVCPGDYVGQVTIDEHDGTIIRAVKPWTATLMPAENHPDFAPLITIAGVENTKIVGINVEVPTAEVCGQVDAAFDVEGAPHTILRSNHIRAIGTDTLGDCGYQRGIDMTDSPDSLVAWNRMIDFTFVGISVRDSSGVRVRGNTVRFNHADEDGVGDANGINLFGSPQGQVLSNVVGSLATAGDTTPIMDTGIAVVASNDSQIKNNNIFRVNRGINTEGTSNLTISGNRVRFAESFGIGLLFSTVDSTVANNSAKAGDDNGITVESNSTGNEIEGNDFRNNGGTDCRDTSNPLANTWTNNLGAESSQPDLCSTT